MLYPVIGCVLTIVIGIVVSLITAAVCPGRQSSTLSQETIPDLLAVTSPSIDRLFGRNIT